MSFPSAHMFRCANFGSIRSLINCRLCSISVKSYCSTTLVNACWCSGLFIQIPSTSPKSTSFHSPFNCFKYSNRSPRSRSVPKAWQRCLLRAKAAVSLMPSPVKALKTPMLTRCIFSSFSSAAVLSSNSFLHQLEVLKNMSCGCHVSTHFNCSG